MKQLTLILSFIKEADGSIWHRYFETNPSKWPTVVTPRLKKSTMRTVFSNRIDKILGIGIYMGDNYIHNWALTREQALQALDAFENLTIAVAGGDVIDYQNGSYGFESSSWGTNRYPDELYEDYAKRSIEDARRYINKYPNDDDFFAIVPG